jgi:hypothetical protein
MLLSYIGFQKHQHQHLHLHFHKHTSISSYITYPQYVLLALWDKIIFHYVDFIQVEQLKKNWEKNSLWTM